jgi:hypothetical protein
VESTQNLWEAPDREESVELVRHTNYRFKKPKEPQAE